MRQSGYYWVKRNNRWGIGYFQDEGDVWWLPATKEYYVDSEFEEIDETRIERKTTEQ